MTEALHPEIGRFLDRLPEETAGYRASVFWERMLDGRQSLDDLLTPAVTTAAGDAPAREQTGFHHATAAAKEADKIAATMRQLVKRAGPEPWEHAQAVGFLRRQDALDDYLDFLDRHRLRSMMPNARHFWHAQMIGDLIRNHVGEPVRIVEIGAGPAWLSVALNDQVDITAYVSVELPQNIVQGAYVASRWLAEKPLNVGELGDGWSFIPPRLIDDIPDGSVDVILNISSFMEMDREARDGYIGHAYRVGRPGALFFNVNRRQRALPQRDGSTFDNNPLLYPYRPDDDVLVWEEDAFQQATRSVHQGVPSLAIVRAALLG